MLIRNLDVKSRTMVIFYQINYEYLYQLQMGKIVSNYCTEIMYIWKIPHCQDLINLSNSFTPHLLRRFCRKVKQEEVSVHSPSLPQKCT